jgi:hypothetical protein
MKFGTRQHVACYKCGKPFALTERRYLHKRRPHHALCYPNPAVVEQEILRRERADTMFRAFSPLTQRRV